LQKPKSNFNPPSGPQPGLSNGNQTQILNKYLQTQKEMGELQEKYSKMVKLVQNSGVSANPNRAEIKARKGGAQFTWEDESAQQSVRSMDQEEKDFFDDDGPVPQETQIYEEKPDARRSPRDSVKSLQSGFQQQYSDMKNSKKPESKQASEKNELFMQSESYNSNQNLPPVSTSQILVNGHLDIQAQLLSSQRFKNFSAGTQPKINLSNGLTVSIPQLYG
jgi:hypothetical protein